MASTKAKIEMLVPMPREYCDRHKGKYGIAAELAEGSDQIALEVVENRDCALIAVGLARGLQGAELYDRLAARLGRRHAGCDVVIGVTCDVGFEFCIKFFGAAGRIEETTQALPYFS